MLCNIDVSRTRAPRRGSSGGHCAHPEIFRVLVTKLEVFNIKQVLGI